MRPHSSVLSQSAPTAGLAMRTALTATTAALPPILRHHLTLPAAHGRDPVTVAVHLTPKGDGAFRATCPEFPEIRVYGESEEDILLLVQEAIEDFLGARRIRLAAIA